MTQYLPIIGFAVLLLAIGVLMLIFRNSPEKNLQRWLADNGLRPIEQLQGSFSRSPFSYLSTSRGDRFYRIVANERDERKSGWVRASRKFSALGERVTVIWDDPPGA